MSDRLYTLYWIYDAIRSLLYCLAIVLLNLEILKKIQFWLATLNKATSVCVIEISLYVYRTFSYIRESTSVYEYLRHPHCDIWRNISPLLREFWLMRLKKECYEILKCCWRELLVFSLLPIYCDPSDDIKWEVWG